MGTLEIALRLGAATLAGVVLGLNRDLHGKSTGVRTLGLVCLGSALAVLSIHAVTGTDASRVIQGIVTGVGFLGAGVIVRGSTGHRVHGLTTAACVWVTACLGAACAIAEWQIVVLGIALVFVILILADPSRRPSSNAGRSRNQPMSETSRPTERACLGRTNSRPDGSAHKQSSPRTRGDDRPQLRSCVALAECVEPARGVLLGRR